MHVQVLVLALYTYEHACTYTCLLCMQPCAAALLTMLKKPCTFPTPYTAPLSLQAVYEVYDIVEGPTWQRLEQQWSEEQQLIREQQQQEEESESGQQQQQQQQRGATPGQRATARPTPGRSTRLVVIGRHLDRAQLQRGLEACKARGAQYSDGPSS